MFFSFLNRFTSKKHPPISSHLPTNFFEEIAADLGGVFFADFKLFYQDTSTSIDLLLFVPERGLYIGENITWTMEELKGATVERSSRRSKKPATTRFGSVQTKIYQKLQDVLSFDSTVCERFMRLENLEEAEFDALDPSFHELLPKSHLIFRNEPKKSIIHKLETIIELQTEPYSAIKVIGSLNAHELLLPTSLTPFGAFLSDEQNQFLRSRSENTVTTLCGEYGSGKSTVLIRKAMGLLLHHPEYRVLIITPTLLAGELLRNEFVSLMEYGALDIDLSRIIFYTPHESDAIEDTKIFQESSAVLCDDAHCLEEAFLERLKHHRGQRWLLFSTITAPDMPSEVTVLLNVYRANILITTLECSYEKLLITTLLELRKALINSSRDDLLLVLPNKQMLSLFKKSVDEYLGTSCRVLTPEFSLQYENLDDVILATPEMISGLSTRHLFLVTEKNSGDYTYMLSRASETATIISFTNFEGDNDEQNYQE